MGTKVHEICEGCESRQAEIERLKERCAAWSSLESLCESRDAEITRLETALAASHALIQKLAESEHQLETALAEREGELVSSQMVIDCHVADKQELKRELASLESRFPKELEGCEIVFKKCEVGHSWLTATNWVQHECPTCRREQVEKELAESRAEVERLTRELANWIQEYEILAADESLRKELADQARTIAELREALTEAMGWLEDGRYTPTCRGTTEAFQILEQAKGTQ